MSTNIPENFLLNCHFVFAVFRCTFSTSVSNCRCPLNVLVGATCGRPQIHLYCRTGNHRSPLRYLSQIVSMAMALFQKNDRCPFGQRSFDLVHCAFQHFLGNMESVLGKQAQRNTAAFINALGVVVAKTVKIQIGLIGIPQERRRDDADTFTHGNTSMSQFFSLYCKCCDLARLF